MGGGQEDTGVAQATLREGFVLLKQWDDTDGL